MVRPKVNIGQATCQRSRSRPLRTADAFQLAAAIVAAEDQPATLPLVTLDGRLAQAAEREGFEVTQPG
jgi:predicted nucleic acid-binding protein